MEECLGLYIQVMRGDTLTRKRRDARRSSRSAPTPGRPDELLTPGCSGQLLFIDGHHAFWSRLMSLASLFELF